MASLYLIPTLLSENGKDHIPPVVVNSIESLSHFIAERTRTARRFIKVVSPQFDIDAATFLEMDKHDANIGLQEARQLFEKGMDIGLISEAGLPCIADPGAKYVNMAREYDYDVVPMTGPSSIMLGLMASGLDGQRFTFHGYLPVKEPALTKALKKIESEIKKTGYTQIWIETPYRNDKMLQTIIKHVSQNLRLSISSDLTGPDQRSDNRKITKWKGETLGKMPAIFLLGK